MIVVKGASRCQSLQVLYFFRFYVIVVDVRPFNNTFYFHCLLRKIKKKDGKGRRKIFCDKNHLSVCSSTMSRCYEHIATHSTRRSRQKAAHRKRIFMFIVARGKIISHKNQIQLAFIFNEIISNLHHSAEMRIKIFYSYENPFLWLFNPRFFFRSLNAT